MSIRAYARHRGISHPAVLRAIRDQRISQRPDGKIDSEVADQQWEMNTDPTKPLNSVSGNPKHRKGDGPSVPPSLGSNAGPGPDPETRKLLNSFNVSKTMRERYLALRARLEFEQLEGRLVDADQVRHQVRRVILGARSVLLGMPARVAPRCLCPCGKSDQLAIEGVLDAEVDKALQALSAGLASLGPPAAAEATPKGSKPRPASRRKAAPRKKRR